VWILQGFQRLQHSTESLNTFQIAWHFQTPVESPQIVSETFPFTELRVYIHHFTHHSALLSIICCFNPFPPIYLQTPSSFFEHISNYSTFDIHINASAYVGKVFADKKVLQCKDTLIAWATCTRVGFKLSVLYVLNFSLQTPYIAAHFWTTVWQQLPPWNAMQQSCLFYECGIEKLKYYTRKLWRRLKINLHNEQAVELYKHFRYYWWLLVHSSILLPGFSGVARGALRAAGPGGTSLTKNKFLKGV